MPSVLTLKSSSDIFKLSFTIFDTQTVQNRTEILRAWEIETGDSVPTGGGHSGCEAAGFFKDFWGPNEFVC